jgi:flagellar hook-length control protein FliK
MIGATLPPARTASPAAADAGMQAQEGVRSGDAHAEGPAAAADPAPRGKAAVGRAQRDPQSDGGARDDRFARLLEPEPAADAATRVPPPQADAPPLAADATEQPATATLPEQLLGLLAMLGPDAAVSPPRTQPPTTPAADTSTGTAPTAQAGLAASLAAILAPAAGQAASKPGAIQAGAGMADAAAAALAQHPAGTPAQASGARGEHATHATALPLPAAAPPAPDAATPADPFARLLADASPANVMRDGLQADPATPPGQSPLLAQAAPGPGTVRAPTLPQAPLAHPGNPSAGYGDDFGNSVLWMADRQLSHAQLRISPDHLGPIDVRLQVDGARVHAEFSSTQADVRQALEASLPRLREMLGQHGLELAQADVGQRQQDPRTPRPGGPEPSGRDPEHDGLTPTLPTRARIARGLLDEYA